jgi:RHS repeat-associated protein
MKNNYEINYFITDHLGSTRARVDNAGNITAQYNYYPFGKQWEDANLMANTNRWGYNGKEKQIVGNLNYLDYINRMYDPEIGRWFVQDPLQEKFYSWSSYNYCMNNPLKYVDPDGKNPIIPALIYYLTARTMESSTGNHNIRQAGYAMQHPINALRAGEAKDGGNNLSSIASNFAINIQNAAGLTGGSEGDQRNAIRHTLWQAILTNDMGADHAERIANAHEDGINVDINQRKFNNSKEAAAMEQADRVIDLLNNKIGRDIGEQNTDASNRRLAGEVVLMFYQNGLWTATEQLWIENP